MSTLGSAFFKHLGFIIANNPKERSNPQGKYTVFDVAISAHA